MGFIGFIGIDYLSSFFRNKQTATDPCRVMYTSMTAQLLLLPIFMSSLYWWCFWSHVIYTCFRPLRSWQCLLAKMLERVEVGINSPRDNHEMFGMFVRHLIDNKTDSKFIHHSYILIHIQCTCVCIDVMQLVLMSIPQCIVLEFPDTLSLW